MALVYKHANTKPMSRKVFALVFSSCNDSKPEAHEENAKYFTHSLVTVTPLCFLPDTGAFRSQL